MPRIGIIGGSGLYEIGGLKNARWVKVKTPFGWLYTKTENQYLGVVLRIAKI